MKKKSLFLIVGGLSIILLSCLGAGKRLILQQSLTSLPYDKAFEFTLKSAKEMEKEYKKINPINFPIIVSSGTSKSKRSYHCLLQI